MSPNTKQGLNDVYVLRPVAIFFIIVYHSFIIYRGGWSEPINYQNVTCYHAIATISYAFWLELFVFISGYVFALSLTRKMPTFKNIVIGKFKRLIIPSIIFSIAYYFMFYYPVNFSITHCILEILSGTGHMWYLPMLFWTMLICYSIDRFNISQNLKVVGVLLLPILSLASFPLRLNDACYYTMYFYIGMLFFRNKELLLLYLAKSKMVITWGIMFTLLFAIGYFLREYLIPDINNDDNIVVKVILHITSRYIKIVYCLVGIVWIYSLVNYLLKKKYISITTWIINLSALCYGIYLFQQFILKFLYYKTTLPIIVGPYYLPWIGLIITLIISYYFTKICRITRIGKWLM